MPTYHCPTCGDTFPSERNYLEECPYCGAPFPGSSAIYREEAATNETYCGSCRQTFIGSLTDDGRCPLCGGFPDGYSAQTNKQRQTNEGATNAEAQESAQEGMFKETDYVPFMLGVFLIGGLIGIPLTYGAATGLGYFESLPWALGSCVVFLIAFRRNGTISWGRAIPAFAAIMIGASVYNQSTGKPAFSAGGVGGFLLITVCGYVGLGPDQA